MTVTDADVHVSMVAQQVDGLGAASLAVDGRTGDAHVVAVIEPPRGSPPGTRWRLNDKIAKAPDYLFSTGQGVELINQPDGSPLPAGGAGRVQRSQRSDRIGVGAWSAELVLGAARRVGP